MEGNAMIAQTLERMNAVLQKVQSGPGLNVSAGLQYYDLEAEAKMLYPVLAPIRKRMARIGKKGAGQGLAVNWKIITDPNSARTSAVVSEGKRGGQITPKTADKVATYKGIGLENVVTWEAEYGAEGFDDIRAIAQRTTLDALILREEPMLLWGNSSNALGKPSAPTGTGTTAASTGTLADTTYYLFVVPLSLAGLEHALAQSPAAVVPTITRVNADSTTDTINSGVGIMSNASAGIAVSGGSGTGKITAQVAAVKGAAGYAWFIGTANTAANCYCTAITTINKAVITAAPGTGQTAAYTGTSWNPATDYSTNPLAFDGLITQAMTGNGYFASLDGATLTADSANGIVEIDVALQWFWDTYRISPTRIYVGSQEQRNIAKKIFGGSTTAFRINLENNLSSLGNLTGSAVVGGYTNKFAPGTANGPMVIPIELHPNMPNGHIFFDTELNPYPTANIPYARAVRTRRDYFNVVWPVVSRSYQNGVYSDQVLQLYIPYGLGLLSNVGDG